MPETGSFQKRQTPGSSSCQWQGKASCASRAVRKRHPSCGTTWRASRHIGQAAGASKCRCQNPQLSQV